MNAWYQVLPPVYIYIYIYSMSCPHTPFFIKLLCGSVNTMYVIVTRPYAGKSYT